MHTLHIASNNDKESKYASLLPQLESLIEGEPDLTANLANIAAALKQTFSWWWIGFYLVKENELVLNAFQGPVACTRIAYHKGVCGTSWAQAKTLVVKDVNLFPGHIACSAATQSEIVVPIIVADKVIGVIDADSEFPAHFNETDQLYLEKVAAIIACLF
jgi:GAF domain-containing protein